MRWRRAVGVLLALAVVATGPACASKNEEKKNLIKLLEKNAHFSGVFRYADETPASEVVPGGSRAAVRGLVEDDFRYKARLSVNEKDVLDEIVADDALAVRFLDPTFIPLFTGTGGTPLVRAALEGKYWVEDSRGAPAIGGAAVSDRLIGLDPIVDALSVIPYVQDAVSQAKDVETFNAERIDYRPDEDPFPRPAKGSGVVRWDLKPTDLPRADAADTGNGNASIAQASTFRKMAIYVKDGRVVQIREQVAARFGLQEKLRDYLERYFTKLGKKEGDKAKSDFKNVEKDPALLEAYLNIGLNQIRLQAGEEAVRFRTMVIEFGRQGEKVKADLPTGSEVVKGDLSFFGVNQALKKGEGGSSAAPTATTTTVPTP